VKHIGHSAGWDDPGEYNPGGMAEFCRVWDEMAYQIPDSISPAAATLLDGLAVAIHAAGKAGLSESQQARDGEFEHVMIMGSGAIGLLILQVVRAFGAKSVISVDNYAKPLEIAAQLGADVVVRSQELEDQVMEHTNGSGANVIFDTVGSQETFIQSLKLLRRGGKLILLAVPPQEVSLDPSLLSGERVVMSSANNTYPCFPLAIELMKSGKVKADPIITHQYPISEAIEAFRVAEDKEKHGAVKVVITL